MALEPQFRRQLEKAMASAPGGARAIDDAGRLWQRVQRFISMGLGGPQLELDAMELACYALQLPSGHHEGSPKGKLGQMGLRDRAEQAAELLAGVLASPSEAPLLDRAMKLLRQLPQRGAAMPEARLLADAVSLEDFGLTGLISLALHSGGLRALVEGWDKRQQYGYWEARLKDSFHFEPVRQMARSRLEHARQAIGLLSAELKEDQSA